MDLGLLLESPQGSQSSSRVGVCTCDFLPSCSSSVTLPFAWIKDLWLSLEAFPRAFPRRLHTGLSHVAPWCESILGLKVETVQGKQVSLEWTETSGGLWECGTTLEFLSPFLWRAPPLEMRQERREFFPGQQRKEPVSRARRRKRSSSGCGRNSRASSRVESGMSGNFLSCSKGVKDPLEVPDVRCD